MLRPRACHACFDPVPVTHAEKYNTWESWYFWNITSILLQAGAAFCEESAETRSGLFAHWHEGLIAVQTRHRSNNAFIVYHSAYEAPCKRLQAIAEHTELKYPGIEEDTLLNHGITRHSSWQEVVHHRTRNQIDQFRREIEAIRDAGACDLANMTAASLIDAFGNDTEVTLAMGKALLTRGLDQVSGGRCPCSNLKMARVDTIAKQIGRLPGDDRFNNMRNIYSHWGAWMLTLATAYHKLIPICQPGDPLYARFGPDDWLCDDMPSPPEPDGKLAYDIIPLDKERGYCYGPFCAPAARAIDAFRAFLHEFSDFRMTIVHSMLSTQYAAALLPPSSLEHPRSTPPFLGVWLH